MLLFTRVHSDIAMLLFTPVHSNIAIDLYFIQFYHLLSIFPLHDRIHI